MIEMDFGVLIKQLKLKTSKNIKNIIIFLVVGL